MACEEGFEGGGSGMAERLNKAIEAGLTRDHVNGFDLAPCRGAGRTKPNLLAQFTSGFGDGERAVICAEIELYERAFGFAIDQGAGGFVDDGAGGETESACAVGGVGVSGLAAEEEIDERTRGGEGENRGEDSGAGARNRRRGGGWRSRRWERG